jgi:hypothetical protein
MLRTFVCAAVALALCAGSALAQAKVKKGQAVAGTVKKIDAAAGTLTVAVKQQKEMVDKEFKIDDATKVIVFAGQDKKELSGKDGLKAEQLKEGALVTIASDAAGKVAQIQVGLSKAEVKAAKPKKGQAVAGTIKKVDAAAATFTVAVKSKVEPAADKEFKIDDATKIVVAAGEEKKELTGKAGLKAEAFREGAKVTVTADAAGKVTEVTLAAKKKKEKQ